MRFKIRSLLVVLMLFLGMSFFSWSIVFSAENNNEESPVICESRAPPGGPGYHWGSMNVIGEPVFGQNFNINDSYVPSIACQDDKIYVVWYDSTDFNGAMGDTDIFYRYFDGTSWGPIEVISEPIQGYNFNTAGSYDPDIAVENGNVYVVWQDSNDTMGSGTDSDIFYRTNMSGAGWGPIQVISEPNLSGNLNTGNSFRGEIAVENGNVYVVWTDNNNTDGSGTDYDILYRSNQGGIWQPTQVINEPVPGSDISTLDDYYADIAVENGNIYVVYMSVNNSLGSGTDFDIFYRCNLTGTWEPEQVLSEPVPGSDLNTGTSFQPAIAVENNNIYVVWHDSNNTNNAGTDYDIFYRVNRSGVWNPVEVISEPVFNNNFNTGSSESTNIDVDNNDVYIVWYDGNNTAGSGSDYDILFRRYHSQSASWGKIQVISEPNYGANINTGSSYNPDIEVDNGKSHVVWWDNNNTYSSGANFDIFYRCTFHPPELNNPKVTPVVGVTNTSFNFTVEYRDVDNDPPTQVYVRLNGQNILMQPSNPADKFYINGNLYYYATTLDIGNMHNHRFITNDGYYVRNTPVVNLPDVVNSPPEIITPHNPTATEDVLYETIFEYFDLDNITVDQQMTWKYDSNAPWLTFTPFVPNNQSAVLNGTPVNGEDGQYYVNITINDTMNETWRYFILTVEPVNDPPEILTEDVTTATEDELYEVDYNAADIDTIQANLTWGFSSDAPWLKFNKTNGILNGTPSNDDVGRYSVNVSVSDGQLSDKHSFQIEVLPVNDPPKIITEDVELIIVGDEYSVTYEATDIDNLPKELIWTFDSNAGDWLIRSAQVAWLHGTPKEEDVGIYWINVTVRDIADGFDSHNFILTVEMPPIINLNPEIQGENLLEIEAGKKYHTTYTATDDRTSVVNLTWNLITNATWLSFDSETGNLTGTPTIAELGIYNVTLNVSDGEGGFTERNFQILVKKPIIPPNKEPKLTEGKMSPSSGDTDTTFTFTVHYTDEDGDAPKSIAVVIDGEAHEMVLKDGNASDGTYEYKTKLDKGKHDYYFTAYDGKADAVPGDDTPTAEANAKSTPEINKSEPAGKGGIGDWLWLIIILIIIIVVIILVAVLMRRKRGAPSKEREPARDRRPLEDEEEDWYREREEDEDRKREPEPEEEEEEKAPAKEDELEDWAVVDEDEEAAEEKPDDLEMEEEAAPPAKGKMPGVVRHGKPRKTKWPAKGKMPKKGKTPKAEAELEPEEDEFQVADEDMDEDLAVAEAAPAVPLLTKLNESATCNICLGAIKTGLSVVQCTCSKKYHEACAGRVGVCPTCDTDLTNPKVMEDDEITDDDLESLDD